MQKKFSGIVTKGEIAFVAFCPELGVTSQGKTEKKALENLKEAVELYSEDPDIQEQLNKKIIQKAKVSTISINA